ncbi:TPA: methionine--tRNA ligase [Methanosarcina acetivorans]|uniref:Methionine--tRNA ligase n=3 Tax=Methanosarcina acetivorans TaxID=2214 RepID=SYM_METAC|nr:RecName: Full=Methionine--tRNA ligase; AltName: Full=Methionyl-tRNA synthetase; Short=MetRS [Methanosarcina acetivorans C2A]AAM07394.1 methionyl-tRNA synthetase [Methanosarcina acetivorans C2A]HIH94805.1 methionine--tRNA ligase [Methanosarcina acetivorans]
MEIRMSDSSSKPVLVTCGLPYANGKAHIGHLRTYVPADIFARSLRKEGREVTFVCGSDTHGTPIVVNAEELGITPKELVEIYHKHFDETFKQLGVYFDAFGTTDDPENHNRTLDIVNRLIEKDYVYPKIIEIAYCPACNRFLPDRYVEGACPHCGETARGDECDQGCGKHLEPGELQNPVCTICGGPAEYRHQEHFFFKLSEFGDYLMDYLSNDLGGTTNARNYALGWVKQGLTDWCITRNLEWGVRFPGHEDLVVYVWVDAPIGYIAFTEEWAAQAGDSWEKFWKGEGEIVHFIGGDITYHHCIFWPAMLNGADYSVPTAVVASGMVKIEDKKFSKTRGYVVWVGEDYLDHGFHPDLLRYYLASYTSHTKELNFSWRVLQEKINAELVAVLGNFLYRTMLFAFKNYGEVPEGKLEPEVSAEIEEALKEVKEAMAEYEFKKAVDSAMALASFGNTYFQSHEPWKLIKEDRSACGQVIYNCLHLAKALSLIFEPVLPQTMETAWKGLGQESDIHASRYEEALVPLKAGTKLAKPELLFTKLEDDRIGEMEEIANQRVKAANAKKSAAKGGEKEPSKSEGMGPSEEAKVAEKAAKAEEKVPIETLPQIEYEDFAKLDIRVGKVLFVEPVKKSRKLLRVEVDIGEEKPRQLVAGMASYYTSEELVGKYVVVLANLKPAKLCGVESNGMMLAADDGGAIVAALMPDKEIKPGSRIR